MTHRPTPDQRADLEERGYEIVHISAAVQAYRAERMLEYINDCMAKVVVLTDGDWQMFKRTGYDELILQALASRYELVLTKEAFGQRSDNVYVYLCRPDQE